MTVDGTHPDVSSNSNLKMAARMLVPILLVALGWFGLPYLHGSTTGIGAAAVGACAVDTNPARADGVEVRDCSDPAATLVVLAQVDGAADCFTVAGVVLETSIDLPHKRTCLGTKGADPYRSINTAAAGECLIDSGRERTTCTAPDAAHRILKRIDGVANAAVDAACDAVPGTESSFSRGFAETRSVSTFGSGGATDTPTSVVFCLAPAAS
jgi:hypothetical protein